MNVSILIAMTTPIPVRMIVTISIAMFVKTITHNNHSLKREIMVAISWPLAASLFVCLSDMITTGVAGEYCLLCRFRKCCSAKKRKITLFYSLGVTFVTPPYTSVSINWIQFQCISWICYERSFSEFYLSIWNQLVFNQRLQLFVQSPQPNLLIFASRN